MQLLEATSEILDGYCGPVYFEGQRVLYTPETPPTGLQLDLLEPAVYDYVLRRVAQKLSPGSTGSVVEFWACADESEGAPEEWDGESDWQWDVYWMLRVWLQSGPVTFVFGDDPDMIDPPMPELKRERSRGGALCSVARRVFEIGEG